MSFNPYRVFKFAATLWCRWIWLFAFRFQSLSGFQVRCNDLVACDFTQHEVGFNPYRVFKFAATSFQHFSIIWKLRFNPYRVFKFAATYVLKVEPEPRSEVFQSLSGFQVRCNHRFVPPHTGWRSVSIPIGFSSSLQQRIPYVWLVTTKVSIPIGFSSSLQHSPRHRAWWSQDSFNPYRVFKFAATLFAWGRN